MAAIFRSMALLFVLTVASCATNDTVDRRTAASTSVDDLHESLLAVRGDIHQTLDALNRMTGATSDELEQAYEQYSEQVERVTAQAERVEAISDEMREHRDAWLAEWQESHARVENPELRALSERRRIEMLERWQSVDQSVAAAREALRPFVANVSDINNVVANDLTPGGVAAVARTQAAQNANREGTRAARALGAATAELQALQHEESEELEAVGAHGQPPSRAN
jgi:hypothetical protein